MSTDDRPKTSTRDHVVVREQLTKWLGGRLDGAVITDFTVPSTNGMSSETILFDAEWDSDDGGRVSDRFVLRLPPDPASEPVFPIYDMPRQFRAMRLVADRTAIAVPPTVWLEEDPAALGAPFFVMGRIDGSVPPDVMPYTFGGNWFFESSPTDQLALQRSSVAVLAAIHTIPASDPDAAFLVIDAPGDTALQRHVNDQRAFYEWVAADGVRSPLIESAFSWLDEHWPHDEGETVVSWGDARIGNMMYRDYEPVAVLDWEMAGHGPREIDLAWMIFIHRFFQDLTEMLEMPGLPDFMRTADVCEQYEQLTGVTPKNIRWYLLYAALRHAIVMFRITRRQILFGEKEMPDNPDHAFLHHATVAAMIDGSYWSKLEPNSPAG
ncbi:MAG: phosphotransferase family protein [Ilumatobacteraceae bacterium]